MKSNISHVSSRLNRIIQIMVIMMGAYTAFLALFLVFYDTDHLETLINETDQCDLIGDAKKCEHSMFYNYSKIFGRPEWTVNHQPFDNEEHLAKYLAYWQFRNSTSHLNNFEFFRESYEKAMLESVPMKIKSQDLDEITPECEARLVIYDHALYYHPNSRKPFEGSNRPVHGDNVSLRYAIYCSNYTLSEIRVNSPSPTLTS